LRRESTEAQRVTLVKKRRKEGRALYYASFQLTSVWRGEKKKRKIMRDFFVTTRRWKGAGRKGRFIAIYNDAITRGSGSFM